MLALANVVWVLLSGVAAVVLIGIIIGVRVRGRRKAK
jgi:hypothetical protein